MQIKKKFKISKNIELICEKHIFGALILFIPYGKYEKIKIFIISNKK
jgi:hypothetical protein